MDWTQYAVGGATRPDSFTGMQPAFQSALAQLFAAAPPDIQRQLRVKSGYRSVERQRELWQAALVKYGSPAAARKWVAPPGNSQHNMGFAADLAYLDPSATTWAHQNAAKFGLNFPLGNEDWHIEPIGARSHKSGGMMALVDGKHGVHAPPVGVSPVMAAAGPVSAPTSAAGGMMSPGPTAAPQMFGDLIGQNQVATTAVGPMDFGQVAANLLSSAQERDRAKAETEAAETARRVALFGGADGSGLWGLYA